uniref:Uncharacterized protein n=1 Tax=Salarias fasciatus TaxID=181472 RepID=A0A672FKA2_SALFA
PWLEPSALTWDTSCLTAEQLESLYRIYEGTFRTRSPMVGDMAPQILKQDGGQKNRDLRPEEPVRGEI